jgi:hypothetical protein
MSTFSEVHSTLTKAVANSGIGLPIQYEGIKFDSNKAAYARATILPNQPSFVTLGSRGLDYHHGILQIDLFYPNNGGITDLVAKADVVNQYFYPTRVLQSTNLCVRIGMCSLGPRLNIGGWIMQPLSIDYFCYADRIMP